jgi:diguanylate cyclase (GGDEF)-like protein
MAEKEHPSDQTAPTEGALRIRDEFKNAGVETLQVIASEQASRIEMLEAWGLDLGRKNEELGQRDRRFRAAREKDLLDRKRLEEEIKEIKAAHAREVIQLQDKYSEDTQKLALLTTLDLPTGWINKGNADKTLGEMARTAKREDKIMALLDFDIDNFKSINDKYGHAVGDAVIKRVTELVKECVRSADMTARVGGEEFRIACAVNRDTAKETLAHIATAMCTSVAQKFFIGPNGEIIESNGAPIPSDARRVTISIGTTLFELPGDPKDKIGLDVVDATIKRATHIADQVLYFAKNDGRNRAHYGAHDFQPGVTPSDVLYPIETPLTPVASTKLPNPTRQP